MVALRHGKRRIGARAGVRCCVRAHPDKAASGQVQACAQVGGATSALNTGCASPTGEWCEQVRRVANIPRWDHALLSSWWRGAGHLVRLAQRQPDRWIARILKCCDAAYRRIVCGVLWRQNDSTRQKLNHGSRHTIARRWYAYRRARTVADSSSRQVEVGRIKQYISLYIHSTCTLRRTAPRWVHDRRHT